MSDVNTRLVVAQLVAGKAETLFKAFGKDWTRRDRENAWEAIRLDAIAGGCTNLAKKDWIYVRDTIYGGAKRDALKKYDIAKKSGEGAVKFTKTDNIILDAIGRESSAVKGLDVGDTEEIDKEEEDVQLLEDKMPDDEKPLDRKPLDLKPSRSIYATIRTPRGGARKSPSGRSSRDSSEDIDSDIKRAKLELLEKQIKGQDLLNQRYEFELSMARSRSSSSLTMGSLQIGQQQSGSLGVQSGSTEWGTTLPRSSAFQPILRTEEEQKRYERTMEEKERENW